MVPVTHDAETFILEQRRHIYNMVVRSNTDGDTLRMLPEFAHAIEHYQHSRWASAVKILKSVSTAIGDTLSRQLIVFALEFSERRIVFRNDWGSLWDPNFGEAIVAMYKTSLTPEDHQDEFAVNSRQSFFDFGSSLKSSGSLKTSGLSMSSILTIRKELKDSASQDNASVRVLHFILRHIQCLLLPLTAFTCMPIGNMFAPQQPALLPHDESLLPAIVPTLPTSPKNDQGGMLTASAALDRHGSNFLDE